MASNKRTGTVKARQRHLAEAVEALTALQFAPKQRNEIAAYSGFQMGAPASCGQSVQRVTFPPESTTCQVQPAGCGRTDLKTAIYVAGVA